MLCALIMAGGKGTRFWPLSTEEKPKQFLSLIGEETMLQMTVNRITPIIPVERIFVCTGERYISLVKEQLPALPERNIIVEPEGRNTAPCVSLSAMIIKRYYEDATMVVLASDHLIREEEQFRNIVSKSDEFLNDYSSAIVTLGMKPNRAETGYGYIELGQEEFKSNSFEVYKVNRFVEKPNKEKAIKYLEQGNFLWNGGMFIWKIDGILSKIKKYIPNTYKALEQVSYVNESKLKKFIKENYKDTDAISVDYGILEKSDEIYVVPSDIGWDDVGSWEAIERYSQKDKMGNIHIGNINSIKSFNNLVVASNHNIIIDRLSDIFVVENDGKIIIGSKGNVNKIKELKDII